MDFFSCNSGLRLQHRVASRGGAGYDFLGKSIANRLAWGTNGLDARPGLPDGDGGPGATGAERISGRRKSHPEGPVERAAEALGRRASRTGRDRSSPGPQGPRRSGQCGPAYPYGRARRAIPQGSARLPMLGTKHPCLKGNLNTYSWNKIRLLVFSRRESCLGSQQES